MACLSMVQDSFVTIILPDSLLHGSVKLHFVGVNMKVVCQKPRSTCLDYYGRVRDPKAPSRAKCGAKLSRLGALMPRGCDSQLKTPDSTTFKVYVNAPDPIARLPHKYCEDMLRTDLAAFQCE